MFGTLPAFAADTPQIREALMDIGKAGGIMDAKDELSEVADQPDHRSGAFGNNPNNPYLTAGFTFLGQFLDHDMTFDPTSSLERQVDPEHISNFRTPSLALDNVYGAGPGGSPHLYDQERRRIKLPARGDAGRPGKFDVPRNSQNVRADRRSAQRREPDRLAAAARVSDVPQRRRRLRQGPARPDAIPARCSPRRSAWCAGTTSGSSCTSSSPRPAAQRWSRTC